MAGVDLQTRPLKHLQVEVSVDLSKGNTELSEILSVILARGKQE